MVIYISWNRGGSSATGARHMGKFGYLSKKEDFSPDTYDFQSAYVYDGNPEIPNTITKLILDFAESPDTESKALAKYIVSVEDRYKAVERSLQYLQDAGVDVRHAKLGGWEIKL